MDNTLNATRLFSRACQVIPGGVNSPVRAFAAVGGEPIFVTEGSAARVRTVDGRELVDFCGSWGPLILGHAHASTVAAIAEAAQRGTTFGISTPGEVELAELLCRHIPAMEKVRLVNSGTEAVMTALRLARGYTGRDKLVKFAGCYHGHVDALLVEAGSGLLTGGVGTSAGIPACVAGDTFALAYNDLAAAAALIEARGDEVAAIIVEPVAGNMGLVPAREDFLRGLRALCDRCGALLIFDEVITGFRLAPTTYGTLIGIDADLTTLGKIVGGGLPIGALGGRGEIMDRLAPQGPVYQAGTLSGNPIAVAAGLATLRSLIETPPYADIARKGQRLAAGLNALADTLDKPWHCASLGGMFTPFFARGPLHNLAEVKTCDLAGYARFFRAMLRYGFYLPPSQFEVAFVSAAHDDADIDAFLAAAEESLANG